MKFGSRHNFHIIDGIGDLIVHFWRSRGAFTMQDLVRRFLKCAALVLVIYAMTNVLYPTQYRGWLLWLGPDEGPLAKATAVVLVCFNAMILTLVREAWAHRHHILASASGIFMVILMIVVLGGTWNYYAATSLTAVATSTAVITGAGNRANEAQTALKDLETAHAQEQVGINAAIANAPANRLNGRAALLRQKASDDASYRAEHQRLETELLTARAAHVTVATDKPDPRPIDATMAAWFHVDRTFMGSINDLIRSMNFEFIAILGVALGTAVALSRAGAAQEPAPSGLAIEDMRLTAKREEEPQTGEPVVQKREVVYDENGDPMVYRKPTYARKPKFSRSSRAKDDTEYEAPARTVASDPRVHGDAEQIEPHDFTAGGPVMEKVDGDAKATDRDARPIPGGERDIVSSGARDEPASVKSSVEMPSGNVDSLDDNDHDEIGVSAPILTDAEIQRGLETGAIVPDENGDLVAVSQEGAEQIEQPDKQPNWPALAAPAKEEQAA